MTVRWQSLAACRDTPPAMWFTERGAPTAPALAVCRECPVVDLCLAYCLSLHPKPEGVWGGTTAADRRRIRRQMKAGAA